MNRSFAPAILLLAGASACAEYGAEEAELLVPDDLAMPWDRSFNGEADDRVALVPVDLMVYHPESGEPVVGVALEVEPTQPHVEVLPFDEIVTVDAEDCADGPCVWDAWRDRYVDILPNAESASPDWLATDENGLVRAYLLVDAFPEAGTAADFESVSVLVSMGMTDASFQLVPQ